MCWAAETKTKQLNENILNGRMQKHLDNIAK